MGNPWSISRREETLLLLQPQAQVACTYLDLGPHTPRGLLEMDECTLLFLLAICVSVLRAL